ncbi:MAG: RraA family protein [Anaerolineae bacterium]|jgi:regulator of RNase E activity RraA
MVSEAITQSDLDLLGQYDTPTVCNVIELFDVRPRNTGYMDRRVACCFPEMPPMVGFAATATFRSAAPPRSGDGYSGLEEQVAAFLQIPGPPVVVFQDLDVPPIGATFGEIMCATYKAFGAVGLITSGTGRDLDQVRELEFPVFTDGVVCSHGYNQILSVHVPVHVGGITVHPGDLLHGDRNGVTTIPGNIAHQVAHACAEFAAAEGVVLDCLKSGSVSPEALAKARGEQRRLVAALQERIRLAR